MNSLSLRFIRGPIREQIVAATRWAIRFAGDVQTTTESTRIEMSALRDLEAHTAAAHGQMAGEAKCATYSSVTPSAPRSAASAAPWPACAPMTWRQCR
jgi:hypothetical protein